MRCNCFGAFSAEVLFFFIFKSATRLPSSRSQQFNKIAIHSSQLPKPSNAPVKPGIIGYVDRQLV